LIVPPCATQSRPCRRVRADALDRAAHAVVKVHKTFAARRRIVDRRKPVAADLDRPAGEERRAVEPLPFAEMLFGKCDLVLQLRSVWESL